MAGHTLREIRQATGLSAPTVIGAYKRFLSTGWAGIGIETLGRRTGQGRSLSVEQERALADRVLDTPPEAQGLSLGLWTSEGVSQVATRHFGQAPRGRAMACLLQRLGLRLQPLGAAAARNPALSTWRQTHLEAVVRKARQQGATLAWCGQLRLPGPAGARRLLVACTLRGNVAWLPLLPGQAHRIESYTDFLQRLSLTWPKARHIAMHGIDVSHPLLHLYATGRSGQTLHACPVGLASQDVAAHTSDTRTDGSPEHEGSSSSRPLKIVRPNMTRTHLQRLEAESIHILREVVAEAERPVMLYSVGKDSATMLHLARKAFYPSPPPFPLLHVDTTWKFRDMYALRDRMAKETGMDLLVWHNPEAKAMGINPFDHGSQIHTDMWKTQGLKQALDHFGFDAAFGGARRDEEKSRAKERVFSFRSAQHRWDPKQQRPELWSLYNARKRPGESIRVFPISNWTELDIWQYIYLENIPIVPLYFAKERPVVDRNGTLLMVDDERFRLEPGEVPVMRKVRFRTLGCYPLSGAIESEADTLPAIIQEMLLARTSERQGRMIDHDQSASMEKKKQEGYF